MSNKDSLDAMHLVKENVIEMKDALLKGDMNTFAKLIDKSWQYKKQVSKQVSNKEI